jgi:hypothetical protein
MTYVRRIHIFRAFWNSDHNVYAENNTSETWKLYSLKIEDIKNFGVNYKKNISKDDLGVMMNKEFIKYVKSSVKLQYEDWMPISYRDEDELNLDFFLWDLIE